MTLLRSPYVQPGSLQLEACLSSPPPQAPCPTVLLGQLWQFSWSSFLLLSLHHHTEAKQLCCRQCGPSVCASSFPCPSCQWQRYRVRGLMTLYREGSWNMWFYGGVLHCKWKGLWTSISTMPFKQRRRERRVSQANVRRSGQTVWGNQSIETCCCVCLHWERTW